MSGPFDFLPDDWTATEKDLWAHIDDFHGGIIDDPVAQALYDEGYFSPNKWSSDELSAIRGELDRHMMAEYGVDFSEIFDWDAWREAYGEMSN